MEYEFKEIGAQIFDEYVDHSKKIKDLNIRKSIVVASKAFAQYEVGVKEIVTNIKATKQEPTLHVFKEIFKVLDDYPTNIPKPKKPQKESLRLNSVMPKTSSAGSSSCMSTNIQENIDSASATTDLKMNSLFANDLAVLMEKERDKSFASIDELQCLNDISLSLCDKSQPTQILRSFERFNEQLRLLQVELEHNESSVDYLKKLHQFEAFTQQLEKLSHTEPSQNALTGVERSSLCGFLESLDNLDYIELNEKVDQFTTETMLGSGGINALGDMLTYTFKSITN